MATNEQRRNAPLINSVLNLFQTIFQKIAALTRRIGRCFRKNSDRKSKLTNEQRRLRTLGYLVLNVFPKIFQTILLNIAPLTKYVCRSYSNNIYLKIKLNKNEVFIVKNVDTDGYSEFSLQLSYKFFRFFEWLDPPSQKLGHEPLDNDIGLADDIERIRLLTNRIISIKNTAVEEVEYTTIISKVKQIAQRIDCYCNEKTNHYFAIVSLEKLDDSMLKDVTEKIINHDKIEDDPFPKMPVSEGRTRYARLCILVVDVVQNMARDVLTSLTNVDDVLKKASTLETTKEKKKRIPKHFYSDLRKMLRGNTFQDIDFSLAYSIIRTLKILPEPTQRYDCTPTNSDQTLSDDIERLRSVRNSNSHRINSEVSETEMNLHFSTMEEVAGRIDQQLGKTADTSFKSLVSETRTCILDYDQQQKYIQVMEELEQLKERYKDERMSIYYGKSFEALINTNRIAEDGAEKYKIKIIIENIRLNEQEITKLNEIKDEINKDQNLVELVEAIIGSLVLKVHVHHTAITSDSIAGVLSSFIQRLLNFIYVDINDLEVLNVILISEDDFSVLDIDGLESCFSENLISPGALQLEVNVKTELFDSDQLLLSKLAGLVERAIKSNGKDSLPNVTAILTSDEYDNSEQLNSDEKADVDDGISEFGFEDISQLQQKSDMKPKMSNTNVNNQEFVRNLVTDRNEKQEQVEENVNTPCNLVQATFSKSQLYLNQEKYKDYVAQNVQMKKILTILERSSEYKIQKEQMTRKVENWKLKDRLFVETRAASHVLQCIKTNSCVTVTASSGVGKTFTVHHVALQMADDGYHILPVTNPEDIFKYHNANEKMLYVIDDLCGTYTLNQTYLAKWKTMQEDIKELLKNDGTKVIASCRLQVYQDEQFKFLPLFTACECNLLLPNMSLSKEEKQVLAKKYLESDACKIDQSIDLFDFFPLLCKLYNEHQTLSIVELFKNPFSVYEEEIDKLNTEKMYGKYCALALCVMFNNHLEEKWLTDDVNQEIKQTIENTCEACRLNRGTSRLVLKDELDSLIHRFLKNEQGCYSTIHDKLFDFLSFYFGKTEMLQCIIKNGVGRLISERFLFELKDDSDHFTTMVPDKYHKLYIERMLDDWSKGQVETVFTNINMKKPYFRKSFLMYLKNLDISDQKILAQKKEETYDEADWALLRSSEDAMLTLWKTNFSYMQTPLLHCCALGDTDMVEWCCNCEADMNLCSNIDESPLYIACQGGYTDIVTRLLDNNADINKCTQRGESPLYIACKQGFIKLVEILITKGADHTKCDKTGQSPLDIATLMGHDKIVNLFAQHSFVQ